MQAREAEALAIAALERFRYLHLYADRKLIAQGHFLVAARRLHLRTRRGIISSTALGLVLLLQTAQHVWQAFAVGAGWARALSLVTAALMGLFALALMLGASWAHGRTRELVSQIEALSPEPQPRARAPSPA